MVTANDLRRRELGILYESYSQLPLLQKVADGKTLVMPAGPVNSPMMVIGEAPGSQEERAGEPFVGESGQLLQDLFAKAGLAWELTYRTNVLPWRPPGNRTPYPFEIVESFSRVQAEISLIDPLAVLAVGATAWHAVTQDGSRRLSDSVGGPHLDVVPGRRVFAVYHPSYILRAAEGEQGRLISATTAVLCDIPAAPGA